MPNTTGDCTIMIVVKTTFVSYSVRSNEQGEFPCKSYQNEWWHIGARERRCGVDALPAKGCFGSWDANASEYKKPDGTIAEIFRMPARDRRKRPGQTNPNETDEQARQKNDALEFPMHRVHCEWRRMPALHEHGGEKRIHEVGPMESHRRPTEAGGFLGARATSFLYDHRPFSRYSHGHSS